LQAADSVAFNVAVEDILERADKEGRNPSQIPMGYLAERSETRRHVFGGFRKCCYPLQKFDSDPERRLSVLMEGDSAVEKWLKPARNQFQIEYRSGDGYEPDFVVETKDRMLICEVKARNELDDPVVLAKAAAAVKWCKTATEHRPKDTGKPWSYVLVPDDQIIGSATLEGLVGKFTSA
jgi:type III restriction enzyme